MNEYIILNKLTYEASDRIIPARYLVPLSTLIYWEPYYQGGTYVYLGGDFHKGTLHVKESPAEIEALIMGSKISSNEFKDEKNEPISAAKYSHLSFSTITADEDPVDYLSDKVNRLIYELEKLEKENAKLKAKNAVLQSANDFIKSMQEVNPSTVSSPQNHCCRETFNKLNEYYHGMNMKVVCHNQQEVHERGQLECWRQSFKDKIEENKNDSL